VKPTALPSYLCGSPTFHSPLCLNSYEKASPLLVHPVVYLQECAGLSVSSLNNPNFPFIQLSFVFSVFEIYVTVLDWNRSVVIATHYGLDGPGNESR